MIMNAARVASNPASLVWSHEVTWRPAHGIATLPSSPREPEGMNESIDAHPVPSALLFLAADWNFVWVAYCDGSSYTSNRDFDQPIVYNNAKLYMRGR